MTGHWLVAVDPGIDAAGVASFELGATPQRPAWRPGESFDEVLRRLGPTTVLRTKPSTPLVQRLHDLGLTFTQFCELPGGLETFVIEQPQMAGAYHGRRGRQQTKGMINAAAMAKLNLAIGVFVECSVCHSELHGANPWERVILQPASRLKKQLRAAVTLRTLAAHNHPLAKERRPSPDLLDAIWLGAAWLADPLRRIDRILDTAERHALPDSVS